jgi:hypothetical protein
LARSRNTQLSDIKNETIKFSTYRKECVNNGGVVKNYALHHHEQTDSLMKKHQNELSNKKTGVEYEVIHFGACRVSRGGHAIPNLDNYDSKK